MHAQCTFILMQNRERARHSKQTRSSKPSWSGICGVLPHSCPLICPPLGRRALELWEQTSCCGRNEPTSQPSAWTVIAAPPLASCLLSHAQGTAHRFHLGLKPITSNLVFRMKSRPLSTVFRSGHGASLLPPATLTTIEPAKFIPTLCLLICLDELLRCYLPVPLP